MNKSKTNIARNAMGKFDHLLQQNLNQFISILKTSEVSHKSLVCSEQQGNWG